MAELPTHTFQYQVADHKDGSTGIFSLLIDKPNLPSIWAHDSRRPVHIYQLPLKQIETHIQCGRDDGTKPAMSICVDIEPGVRLPLITYTSFLGLVSSLSIENGFTSAYRDINLIPIPPTDLIQQAKKINAVLQTVYYFNSTSL